MLAIMLWFIRCLQTLLNIPQIIRSEDSSRIFLVEVHSKVESKCSTLEFACIFSKYTLGSKNAFVTSEDLHFLGSQKCCDRCRACRAVSVPAHRRPRLLRAGGPSRALPPSSIFTKTSAAAAPGYKIRFSSCFVLVLSSSVQGTQS